MKILISEEQLHFLLEQSEIEKKIQAEYKDFPPCVLKLVRDGKAKLGKTGELKSIIDDKNRTFYDNYRYKQNNVLNDYECRSNDVISTYQNFSVAGFPACIRYGLRKGKLKYSKYGNKTVVDLGNSKLTQNSEIINPQNINNDRYTCLSPIKFDEVMEMSREKYQELTKLPNFNRIRDGFENVPTTTATTPPSKSVKPKLKYVATNNFPFKLGSYNANVIKNIQAKLGMKKPDGYFGHNTLAAMKKKYGVDTITKELYDKLNPTNTEVPNTDAQNTTNTDEPRGLNFTTPEKIDTPLTSVDTNRFSEKELGKNVTPITPPDNTEKRRRRRR